MPSGRYPGKAGKCTNCGHYTCISRKPGWDTDFNRCTRGHYGMPVNTHCANCCPDTHSSYELAERRDAVREEMAESAAETEQEASEPMNNPSIKEDSVVVLNANEQADEQTPIVFDSIDRAKDWASRNTTKGTSYLIFTPELKVETPVPNVSVVKLGKSK